MLVHLRLRDRSPQNPIMSYFPSVNNTVSFLSGLRPKRGRVGGTVEAVMLALEGDDDERPKTNIGSLTDRARQRRKRDKCIL